jgi:hypothetical protein
MARLLGAVIIERRDALRLVLEIDHQTANLFAAVLAARLPCVDRPATRVVDVVGRETLATMAVQDFDYLCSIAGHLNLAGGRAATCVPLGRSRCACRRAVRAHCVERASIENLKKPFTHSSTCLLSIAFTRGAQRRHSA